MHARDSDNETSAVPEASNAIKAMVDGISLLPTVKLGLADSRERPDVDSGADLHARPWPCA